MSDKKKPGLVPNDTLEDGVRERLAAEGELGEKDTGVRMGGLYLPASYAARLHDLIEASGANTNEIVRRAIGVYLDNYNRVRPFPHRHTAEQMKARYRTQKKGEGDEP
jgi:hypothetical protein